MKNNLQFDSNGFLQPPQEIITDLQSFKKFFVSDFPTSLTRKTLFKNYLAYLAEFSEKISPKFIQFIDGSFVTNKRNPNDIDFVTFLDYRIFEKSQHLLQPFYSDKLEAKGLDAYLCELYPPTHKQYENLTASYQKEWAKRFSTTKPDAYSEQLSKGFIKLIFTDETK